MLTVNEMFATLQGEGRHLGVRSFFLRLQGCHRKCVWCDTPYTWDGSEKGRKMDAAHVFGQLIRSDARLLVLTGGEPLLHQCNEELVELLRIARELSIGVEVETAGDLLPTDDMVEAVDYWNLSPKLAHACNKGEKPIDPDRLKTWGERLGSRVCLKFVVRGHGTAEALEADLKEIDDLVEAAGFEPSAVWLMPEGVNATNQCAAMAPVFEAAVKRGFNATPRAHILAWGDERKR